MPTLMSGVANRLLGLITPVDVRNDIKSYIKHYWSSINQIRSRKIHCLPKREKYDEFDCCNLEKWLVFREIVLQLDVKLDETIHCDCDAAAFNDHDLSLLIQVCLQ